MMRMGLMVCSNHDGNQSSNEEEAAAENEEEQERVVNMVRMVVIQSN